MERRFRRARPGWWFAGGGPAIAALRLNAKAVTPVIAQMKDVADSCPTLTSRATFGRAWSSHTTSGGESGVVDFTPRGDWPNAPRDRACRHDLQTTRRPRHDHHRSTFRFPP